MTVAVILVDEHGTTTPWPTLEHVWPIFEHMEHGQVRDEWNQLIAVRKDGEYESCTVCLDCLSYDLCSECEFYNVYLCQSCCEEHALCHARYVAHVVDADDMCSNCEYCSDHCHCWTCERCDSRYSESDYACSECEVCEECCRCWYCEGCQERHPADVSRCGECDTCLDRCDCEEEEDTPPTRLLSYDADVTCYCPFWGQPADKLWLGVELETECDQDLDRHDKVAQWTSAIPQWLIGKTDGSLTRGIEFVTAPTSLDLHHNHWPALLGQKGIKKGLKSWDTTTCGIHVHVSRKPLSQLTLGKLLVFMNSESTRRYLVALAGRESVYNGRYSPKKPTDVVKHQYTRYTPLNLQNARTIEFRIFKGTLDVRHILADIEFCHALCSWAKNASLLECEDWSSFWRFACQDKQYKNFVSYMTAKGF